MAPATQYPATLREFVRRDIVKLRRTQERNLLIIESEQAIQEAYKKDATTSDNNAFCAFKKQLSEYGFRVVARQMWPSLGLDHREIMSVYEHDDYDAEKCESLSLKKPKKKITINFLYNQETGEVEWPNYAKTFQYSEQIMECVHREKSKHPLGNKRKYERIHADKPPQSNCLDAKRKCQVPEPLNIIKQEHLPANARQEPNRSPLDGLAAVAAAQQPLITPPQTEYERLLRQSKLAAISKPMTPPQEIVASNNNTGDMIVHLVPMVVSRQALANHAESWILADKFNGLDARNVQEEDVKQLVIDEDRG